MTDAFRILIVEDLPTDAELARREIDKALKKCTYRIVESREAFLDALETFSPDLIVSDFKMPSFDGLTALKLTLERAPTTPVIILTGSQNEDTAVECMKAGATDYVIKEHVKRLGPAVVAALEQKRIRIGKGRAEASLRENEERYRTITENMSDTVWVMDMNFKNTFISPSVLKTRGYTLDELNALPLSKNFTPQSFEIVTRIMAEEMTPERLADKDIMISRSMELEFYRKDGSTFWADSVMTLVRDADGRPKEIIGVGRDITERKQSEALLKESESKYRSILETIHEGYFEVDLRGSFTFFNESAARMLGYDPADLMGLNYRTYTDKQSVKRVFETFNAVFRTGVPRQALDWQLIRNDGTRIFVETSVSLRRDKSGAPIGFFGVAHDVTERKRAEEALRKSEAALKKAQQVAHVGSWAWHIQESRLEWSDEMYRIFGTNKEKLSVNLTDVIASAIHPDDRLAVEGANLSVINDKRAIPLEYRVVWPDGTVRVVWAEAGELILDEAGNPALLTGIAQDITERKRATEALRESENLLNEVGNIAKVGGWELDVKTKEVCWTKETYRIHEVPEEEKFNLSKAVLFFDEPGRSTLEAALARGMEKGEPFDLELPFTTAKSGHLWTRAMGRAVKLDGKVVKLTGTFQDITERKQAEDRIREINRSLFERTVELKESEEKWRTLFETSKDVVYISAVEGSFVDINRAGEELFGYTRDELLTMNVKEIYKDPQDREAFVRRATEQGFVKDYEVTFRKKDGALIDCLLTANVKVDGNGKVIGFQGIIRDVSERKKMERQLVQAEKLASLGGILSGVAHELNNPLTAVIGNAELLMRKEITPEIRDKLETIRKESLRSSKIIQGLLAFAREHKPQRKMIAVNDVIKETYSLREYELRVDDVTMRLDLSDDIPKTAADPYLLQQVFINLINNAHDALVTTGGGALVIRSFSRNGTIVIEFTDDGPGIPESILRFIFDPFFTTKEVGKGTGLGLSIVYGIVKGHGGTIDVTSTPGKGATFTIELPLSRDPTRKEERPEERPKRPHGEKAVLVVEDEQSLRDMIDEALTEEGYLVDCADGGEKAIELIEKRPYDAVVSDLKMPGISGKDLYTFVQKNYPHLVDKILFITGDVLGRETQGFLRITRSPFVEKPFRIEVLLARLSDIVSG